MHHVAAGGWFCQLMFPHPGCSTRKQPFLELIYFPLSSALGGFSGFKWPSESDLNYYFFFHSWINMLLMLALAVFCQPALMRSVKRPPGSPSSLFSWRPFGKRKHKGSWSTIRRKQEVEKRQLFWDGRQRVFYMVPSVPDSAQPFRNTAVENRLLPGTRTSFFFLALFFFFFLRERLLAS